MIPLHDLDLRIWQQRHVEVGGLFRLAVEPQAGGDLGHRSAPSYAAAVAHCALAASTSIHITSHMWPSGSSKLRPYMKPKSCCGVGSSVPPAAFALPIRASTSSRLSAERQISTSLEVFASTIFFAVNCRYLS